MFLMTSSSDAANALLQLSHSNQIPPCQPAHQANLNEVGIRWLRNPLGKEDVLELSSAQSNVSYHSQILW